MFVSRSMTRKVITVGKNTDIFDAQEKMAENRIRHLPVVAENDHLIGVVTDRDIRSAMPYNIFKELYSCSIPRHLITTGFKCYLLGSICIHREK